MEGPVILLSSYKFVGSSSKEEQFNNFYSNVQLPQVAQKPGVLGAYRYVAVEGQPHEYLMILAFENEQARTEALSRASDGISDEVHEEWQRWRSGYLVDYGYNTFREIYTSTGAYHRVEGPIVLMNRFRFVGSGKEAVEFNQWYNNNHAPLVARLPECRGAYRYFATEGQPREYLTFYVFNALEDRAAMGQHKSQEALDEHEQWHRWRSQYLSGFTFSTYREIQHFG